MVQPYPITSVILHQELHPTWKHGDPLMCVDLRAKLSVENCFGALIYFQNAPMNFWVMFFVIIFSLVYLNIIFPKKFRIELSLIKQIFKTN